MQGRNELIDHYVFSREAIAVSLGLDTDDVKNETHRKVAIEHIFTTGDV